MAIDSQEPGNVSQDTALDPCVCISAGRVDFLDAWDLQKTLHRQVADGLLSHVLLLLEHPHVYTLGRRGKDSDVLASPDTLRELGAEVHHIDRGGEATYHGPGQIVAYPIVDLRKWGGGPLKYVRTLEEVVIATLAEFGIQGESTDRPTGVWVGGAKITAIGVRISRGVTMHGFALNVNTDKSYFDHIVPCGMPEASVTTMASELSTEITVAEVAPVLTYQFGRIFGWRME
ncbi:MAG: lipoyl(octanoyl) transferase LipB [Chloroflexi bacterium]|nr:lipoyl(octanoyl) transferase LipB [Chloroflexota bacterium]